MARLEWAAVVAHNSVEDEAFLHQQLSKRLNGLNNNKVNKISIEGAKGDARRATSRGNRGDTTR